MESKDAPDRHRLGLVAGRLDLPNLALALLATRLVHAASNVYHRTA